MATIRPADLPAADNVPSGAAIIVDTGSTVQKATPEKIVDAAAPLASEADAISGVGNNNRMSALRVKQAMDANLATTAALASTDPGKGAGMVALPQGGTVSDAINHITPEQKGATGDGAADDYAALVSARNTGGHVVSRDKTYAITSTLNLTGTATLDIAGSKITQANNTDLDKLVTINIASPGGGISELQWNSRIVVDGNRDNNTTAVTGIEVTKVKKCFGSATLVAMRCDTGVRLTDQVEYADLNIHVDSCGTGLEAVSTSSTTPDEVMVKLFAHACDTLFHAHGTNKMTGTVLLACEGSQDWAINIEQGKWKLLGEARGCGKLGGGGLRLNGSVNTTVLSGDLMLFGGSNENCEWLAELISGQVASAKLQLGENYLAGCKIWGGTEGSLHLHMDALPQAGDGLVLGDASGTFLNNFVILPGSRIGAPSGFNAVNMVRCQNCIVDPGYLTGQVTIGSACTQNTLFIPRRQATSVTIVNNRTQRDNLIVYRGRYTLAALNGLNGGTLFKGMQAEMVEDYGGAPAYYDQGAAKWLPMASTSAAEASAADIASSSVAINATNKYAGKLVWDNTNSRLMRASGSGATAAWWVVDGSDSVTPA